jgi:hypothetical protein
MFSTPTLINKLINFDEFLSNPKTAAEHETESFSGKFS